MFPTSFNIHFVFGYARFMCTCPKPAIWLFWDKNRYQSKASGHFAQSSLSRTPTTWRKKRQNKNEQIC